MSAGRSDRLVRCSDLIEKAVCMHATPNPVVCIVGAGPFGVSVAAHLQFIGINFRIFGVPISRWLSQMPERMFLKSESCASSLCDPKGRYTLARYCRDASIPYPEYGTPVSRALFAQYAMSFQEKLVPKVEDVTVTMVSKSPAGFEVVLSSGETFEAGRVIVATGLDHMAHIPEQLASLPAELRSHSQDYNDLSGFKGREVTVIGGGQSGLETAAILREDGASVHLLVRKPSLAWNAPPSVVHRSRYERWRRPRTKFGDGLGLWVYDNMPGLFRRLPQRIRLEESPRRAGSCWGMVAKRSGRRKVANPARTSHPWSRGARRTRRAANSDQSERMQELVTDHVIAATGYQFNFHNLPFLSQGIKLQLRHEQHSPRLSANFESSMPGLYFTSLGSANSFGPAMRFLAGADYTVRRISRHLERSLQLSTVPFAQSEKCPKS